ncbi:MAG: TRAP transporter small permease subunit [Gammaproteobacteria bacterium]|nr:TRAP transporter small permease subunit [Gammaproteobacteria bacterium]
MLAKITNTIDLLNEWVGKTISWLTMFMVLITFLIVVLRKVNNVGWISMQESVVFMHALVFLLGAAYTLKREGHVRVDIFYRDFSPVGKAWVDFLGALFLLFPVSVFIFWYSFDYVTSSWALQEGSREAGGLPGIYLLKTSLLVMPCLLMLQGLVQILKSIVIISGSKQEHIDS